MAAQRRHRPPGGHLTSSLTIGSADPAALADLWGKALGRPVCPGAVAGDTAVDATGPESRIHLLLRRPVMAATPAKPPAEKLDPAVVRTALILVVGGLAVVFDTTIVSVALHTLAVQLGTSVAAIQWVAPVTCWRWASRCR
jgi:hypothetical protein